MTIVWVNSHIYTLKFFIFFRWQVGCPNQLQFFAHLADFRQEIPYKNVDRIAAHVDEKRVDLVVLQLIHLD